VLVVEHCVAGRQKVDGAEEMPLELLGEDPALVEEVAEDDIAEDDEHMPSVSQDTPIPQRS